MLIGCVAAYEEEALLPGCLQSLGRQVERLVVVDGAYADFPHEAPWSRDATRAIAEAFGAEWIGCGGLAWRDEVEKRNAYLVGEAGDWYVVLDADERMVGSLAAVGLARGAWYALEVMGWRPAWSGWSVRVFEAPARYAGCHKAVWRGERLLRVEGAVCVAPEICRLAHLAGLRTAERQAAKAAYYRVLGAREEAFRREQGI